MQKEFAIRNHEIDIMSRILSIAVIASAAFIEGCATTPPPASPKTQPVRKLVPQASNPKDKQEVLETLLAQAQHAATGMKAMQQTYDRLYNDALKGVLPITVCNGVVSTAERAKPEQLLGSFENAVATTKKAGVIRADKAAEYIGQAREVVSEIVVNMNTLTLACFMAYAPQPPKK